jgi:midasin
MGDAAPYAILQQPADVSTSAVRSSQGSCRPLQVCLTVASHSTLTILYATACHAAFCRCDGPLLAAVKAGHWVLLDELNLAGQSVLEGLNGLLDHRQALFVPELGQSFRAHPRFRLFAAQNPLQEGGGRKGLPKSFLNRFTRVAVELLQPQDLRAIATALHPELPAGLIGKMVDLLSTMQEASSSSSSSSGEGGRGAVSFAVAGGPWEFNLRDLLRWCELVCMFASQQQQQRRASRATSAPDAAAAADAMDVDDNLQQQLAPGSSSSSTAVLSHAQLDAAAEHFVGVLFTQRLRAASDRQQLQLLFQQVWGRQLTAASSVAVTPQASASSSSNAQQQQGEVSDLFACSPAVVVTPLELRVGMARIPRAAGAAAAAGSSSSSSSSSAQQQQELLLPSVQAPLLESAIASLAAGWMVLLVGPGGSGKTSLARLAAKLVGVGLQELALTQGTDTSDLLGSFEQVRVGCGSCAMHRVLYQFVCLLILMHSRCNMWHHCCMVCCIVEALHIAPEHVLGAAHLPGVLEFTCLHNRCVVLMLRRCPVS